MGEKEDDIDDEDDRKHLHSSHLWKTTVLTDLYVLMYLFLKETPIILVNFYPTLRIGKLELRLVNLPKLTQLIHDTAGIPSWLSALYPCS